MAQPAVTCIPSYDLEPRCYLESDSTALYIAIHEDGTISTSVTCNVDALWILRNDTITRHDNERSLAYGPNWQDVGLSFLCHDDWLMKLISPRPDAPGTVEIQCPALRVRLACSSNGHVDVVPFDDGEGVPKECQWENMICRWRIVPDKLSA